MTEEKGNTMELRLRKDSSDATYDEICTQMYKMWQSCKNWGDFVKVTIEFYPDSEAEDE